MSDKEQTYSLTGQGLILMSTVLARAVSLNLFDIKEITEHNLNDYVQLIADRDELWDGTPHH